MANAKSLLQNNPKPSLRQRPFHGRKLQVWEGCVRFDKVTGWVDNPRIRLACQSKKSQVGNRKLTQDEVYEIMKVDPEVKLAVLRDDILQNGLREPIVLSDSGRLLDGNRRFFAIRYLLDGFPKGDPNWRDFQIIPVYVLHEGCTTEDEELVLVEENFHSSLKLEWPDYVKAQFIKADLDQGLAASDIAAKYAWTKRKIAETKRILDIIDDFMAYAMSPPDPEDDYGGGLGLTEQEGERIASQKFQYFNEAQKSFYDALQTDTEFKVSFFRWIKEGKFSSFPEVRIAHKAWKDSEAHSVIASGEPTAAKDAKAIIEYKSRVLKGKNEARTRIEEFTRFLESLTAEVISRLPNSTLKKLRHGMQLVEEMGQAARNVTGVTATQRKGKGSESKD